MKTENAIYLDIVNDYISGKGIDFDEHHLTIKDAPDFLIFCHRFLEREIFFHIVMCIISDLIDTPQSYAEYQAIITKLKKTT